MISFKRYVDLRFLKADFNTNVIELIKTDVGKSHPGLVYAASKVLAEKAAWDYVEANKNDLGYDVTVICPPFVNLLPFITFIRNLTLLLLADLGTSDPASRLLLSTQRIKQSPI